METNTIVDQAKATWLGARREVFRATPPSQFEDADGRVLKHQPQSAGGDGFRAGVLQRPRQVSGEEIGSHAPCLLIFEMRGHVQHEQHADRHMVGNLQVARTEHVA